MGEMMSKDMVRCQHKNQKANIVLLYIQNKTEYKESELTCTIEGRARLSQLEKGCFKYIGIYAFQREEETEIIIGNKYQDI